MIHLIKTGQLVRRVSAPYHTIIKDYLFYSLVDRVGDTFESLKFSKFY